MEGGPSQQYQKTQTYFQNKNASETKQYSMADYYNILGLTQQKGSNFSTLKSAFTQKIRKSHKDRSKRILLHQAYGKISKKLFKNQYPENQLITAIKRGQKNKVKKMLNQNLSLLNYRAKGSNYSILYFAVRSGHYDIVELILKMGCSFDFSQDKSTPMHCAAYYGYQQIIPLLLKYGIPTDIKNIYGFLPIEQACTNQIKQILQNAKKDSIFQLSQKLFQQKMAINIVNIQKDKKVVVKKIILKNYQLDLQDYDDAFHGTSFNYLHSICKYGFKKPGQLAATKKIDIVDGHISLGTTFKGIKNWANAVFVTPSIYYATNRVYAKQHISNQNQVWSPVVQVKVKKGSYNEYADTLVSYSLKKNQPKYVEYRIENLHNKKTNQSNIIIVAIMFVNNNFINNIEDYNIATQKVLNSYQQKKIKKYHQSKIKNG